MYPPDENQMSTEASDTAINIQSNPFRLTRVEIGRIGALQYIKTFWWILIGIPISGILVLILIKDPVAKGFGFVLILWPLTIPARVILVTWKKSKVLLRPTIANVMEDGLYLAPTSEVNEISSKIIDSRPRVPGNNSPKKRPIQKNGYDSEKVGIRVPWRWVKRVWSFADVYVFEGRILQFVMVRKSSFSIVQQVALEDVLVKIKLMKPKKNHNLP